MTNGETFWGDVSAPNLHNTNTGDETSESLVSKISKIHLAAGSTQANTAPLKFTSQSAGLSEMEQGAMEMINNSLHFTNLAVRRTIDQTENVIISDVTVENTTDEVTVYSIPHGANYLTVGKSEEIKLWGLMSSTNAAGTNTLTVRLYYDGSIIGTFVMPKLNRTNVPFELHGLMTVRSIGQGSTSIQYHSHIELVGETAEPHQNGLATGKDSTTSQPIYFTFQWSNASANNSITINQGHTSCIDNNY